MPGQVHEELVDVLRALAELSGHTVRLAMLPDGRVPDLLAFDLGGHRVLCADAKASERPWDRNAQRRLWWYVAWLRGARRWSAVTMLIACSAPADAPGWRDVLVARAGTAGELASSWAIKVDDRLGLASVAWGRGSGGFVEDGDVERLAA